MEWYYSLVLMLGTVFVLMALSLPVAFAFFVTNIVGALIFLGGGAGIETFIRGSMFSISTFSLAPIPFFLVIGEILLRTGLAFRAVDAIDQVIRRVPGRLSVVAVTGGTFFPLCRARRWRRRRCWDRRWSPTCCGAAIIRPWRWDRSSRSVASICSFHLPIWQ